VIFCSNHEGQFTSTEHAPYPEASILVNTQTTRQLWLHWSGTNGVYNPEIRGIGTSANIRPPQGYQMAKNLQSKLSPSDSVHIFDLNKDAVQRLEGEMKTQSGGAVVKVAQTVNEAARDSVRPPHDLRLFLLSYDDTSSIYDLSWAACRFLSLIILLL
jgi:hypothetical protein